MKVSSSDSTERRSFGMFMQRSLATKLAEESPRYERTTRLDSDGRVIFKQQLRLPPPTLVSDLSNPAAQARMAAKKS